MEIILYVAAIIVMIWSIAVQGRLKRLVTKYSKEQAASGKTANDCVREMLSMNDVYGVTMDHVGGELTDNFNPKENKIYLSDSVDGGTSITAIAIATFVGTKALEPNAYENGLLAQNVEALSQGDTNSGEGGIWGASCVPESDRLCILNLTLPNGQRGLLLIKNYRDPSPYQRRFIDYLLNP